MRTGAGAKHPKSLPRTGTGAGAAELTAAVGRYVAWLERQPLATSTRRAYRTKVTAFAGWLTASGRGGGDPLTDPNARDYAVRDFKGHLKDQRYSPRTVNLALAALDNFYRFVGLGSPSVRREELPNEAPRALDLHSQRQLLRAIERRSAGNHPIPSPASSRPPER